MNLFTSEHRRLLHRLLLVLIVLCCSSTCFVKFSFGQVGPQDRLADSEVEALREIAITLRKTNWNFSVNPCSGESGWNTTGRDPKGFENYVLCNCTIVNNTGCHVTNIVLKSQNLSGVLPPELVKLPYLQQLDLTRNYLNGTIPKEWGSMRLLQNISLAGNRLSGRIPEEIGSIINLKELVLDFNQFSGSIPPELGKLVGIQRIMIASNNFTGELPDLSGLTNLVNFRISDNLFTGKLPNYIEKWTKLEKLEIQSSGLEGPIPSGISMLEKLIDLRISDLNGTGAAFPPLSNMKNLKLLILRSCNITGTLPQYLVDMSVDRLEMLDLSFNKLTGEIPKSSAPARNAFESLTYLYLTGNLLSGTVPDWMLKRKNRYIDLSYNSFTLKSLGGDSCPQGSEGNLNLFKNSAPGNNSTGTVPCLGKFICKKEGKSLSLWVGLKQISVTKSSSIGETQARSEGGAIIGTSLSQVLTLNYIYISEQQDAFHINCGGGQDNIGDVTYAEDPEPIGSSRLYLGGKNWAFSSTGAFMDNGNEQDNYIAQNIYNFSIPQLYTIARLSPLSLTYYGFCLKNENYNVNLHFAEIMFTNDTTYRSLGRRIFDVYIQGKIVMKDFNIAEKAGGVGKVLIETFPAVVTSNTLEIRFSWAGKGTTRIPVDGTYGPLISAISVVPNFKPPKKMSAGAVVGIVVSVLCLIFMIVGILWWKGCLQRKNEIDQELRGLDLNTGSFTLRQIKAATNNFNVENKIGEGGFGPVYKGLLLDGTVIAVKQLSSKSKQGNREFLNEIGMISALQHPNLVKLYGCCTEGNQLLLVYEYMENNSLARALFGEGPEEGRMNLDWPTRHKICVGVARGLAYLHEESILKVVHRDIKATNVLLDRHLHPKISDFGLAKLDEEGTTHISTRVAGTFGYMAPEYAMRGYLTDKADVYSFGIVALEIVSGRINTNCRQKEDGVYLLDWALVLQESGNLMDLVDPRLGADFNKEEVMCMVKVALLCTNATSMLRPLMSSVVSMLEGRSVVQSVVQKMDTDEDKLKFKAIRDQFQHTLDQSTSDIQTQSTWSDGPWTGSSTSGFDLYPVKSDDQYWKNRLG